MERVIERQKEGERKSEENAENGTRKNEVEEAESVLLLNARALWRDIKENYEKKAPRKPPDDNTHHQESASLSFLPFSMQKKIHRI